MYLGKNSTYVGVIIPSNHHVATEGNSEDQGRQYAADELRDESHVCPSCQNPERCASLFLRINPLHTIKCTTYQMPKLSERRSVQRKLIVAKLMEPSSMSMFCTVEKLALP